MTKHSWKMSFAKRACGRGCPICAGKKVLKDYNSLWALGKDILPYWDEELNDVSTKILY